MAETMFRIARFKKSSTICDDVSLLAAKCNGMSQDDKLCIDDFISIIKAHKISFPASGKYTTISKISDHHLIVDVDQEPALEIIETEILDINEDFIDGYEHSAN